MTFLGICFEIIVAKYSLRELKLKTKAFNLAVRLSCFRQSNAFNRSVGTAEHTLFITSFFHFLDHN